MKFYQDYRLISDLPTTLPVFPLSGALLLPRADLPLNIYEPRYLTMIADVMAGNKILGLIQPLTEQEEELNQDLTPELMSIGCAGYITSYMETADRRLLITLTGLCRFTLVKELPSAKHYRQAKVSYKNFADDLVIDQGAEAVDRQALLSAFKDYLDANDMNADWDEINAASNETLVNTLSLLAPYPAHEKQALLEAPDLKTRADVLVALTEIALAKYASGKTYSLQ